MHVAPRRMRVARGHPILKCYVLGPVEVLRIGNIWAILVVSFKYTASGGIALTS